LIGYRNPYRESFLKNAKPLPFRIQSLRLKLRIGKIAFFCFKFEKNKKLKKIESQKHIMIILKNLTIYYLKKLIFYINYIFYENFTYICPIIGKNIMVIY